MEHIAERHKCFDLLTKAIAYSPPDAQAAWLIELQKRRSECTVLVDLFGITVIAARWMAEDLTIYLEDNINKQPKGKNPKARLRRTTSLFMGASVRKQFKWAKKWLHTMDGWIQTTFDQCLDYRSGHGRAHGICAE